MCRLPGTGETGCAPHRRCWQGVNSMSAGPGRKMKIFYCEAWIVGVDNTLSPSFCGCFNWRPTVQWHTDNHSIVECQECGATYTEDECPF